MYTQTNPLKKNKKKKKKKKAKTKNPKIQNKTKLKQTNKKRNYYKVNAWLTSDTRETGQNQPLSPRGEPPICFLTDTQTFTFTGQVCSLGAAWVQPVSTALSVRALWLYDLFLKWHGIFFFFFFFFFLLLLKDWKGETEQYLKSTLLQKFEVTSSDPSGSPQWSEVWPSLLGPAPCLPEVIEWV